MRKRKLSHASGPDWACAAQRASGSGEGCSRGYLRLYRPIGKELSGQTRGCDANYLRRSLVLV